MAGDGSGIIGAVVGLTALSIVARGLGGRRRVTRRTIRRRKGKKRSVTTTTTTDYPYFGY